MLGMRTVLHALHQRAGHDAVNESLRQHMNERETLDAMPALLADF
jgi:hypothetical protein